MVTNEWTLHRHNHTARARQNHSGQIRRTLAHRRIVRGEGEAGRVVLRIEQIPAATSHVVQY